MYKIRDSSIPSCVYNDKEKEVWKYCYSRLKKLFKTNACDEFNWSIDQFEKNVDYCEEEIP